MAKSNKFYAVRVGKKPGIYTSWEATKNQVDGYPNAKYKGFTNEIEAQQFMQVNDDHISQDSARSEKSVKNKPEVIVFTDGGSRNHGNVAGGHVKATDPAAWAYLIDYCGKQHADSAGEFGVTNNKMEIMALIQALKWLEANGFNRKSIGVVADSRYVLNAIQKGWLKGWKKRGWKRSSGELKNAELWQQLDQLLDKFPQIQYAWAKGHGNNRGNLFVDELLNQTMDKM